MPSHPPPPSGLSGRGYGRRLCYAHADPTPPTLFGSTMDTRESVSRSFAVDGQAGLWVEEVEASGVHDELDPVTFPNMGSGVELGYESGLRLLCLGGEDLECPSGCVVRQLLRVLGEDHGRVEGEVDD